MIASLNEECETQKDKLEEDVRAYEQQQCDSEKESLQTEINSLEEEIDGLCSCSEE